MDAFSGESATASGSGTMKIRNATGRHWQPSMWAEEQKSAGRDEADKRPGSQGQSIA
jgi:hypothetical protein